MIERRHEDIGRELLGIEQLPVQRDEGRDQDHAREHHDGAMPQEGQAEGLEGAAGSVRGGLAEDISAQVPAVVKVAVKLDGFPLQGEERRDADHQQEEPENQEKQGFAPLPPVNCL